MASQSRKADEPSALNGIAPCHTPCKSRELNDSQAKVLTRYCKYRPPTLPPISESRKNGILKPIVTNATLQATNKRAMPLASIMRASC